MSEPKFIVNTMLGNIARWLRILGYDTLYDKNYRDWEILKIAESENRVIVTRDRGLHHKALNRGLKTIYLHMDDMAKRLAYISLHTGIRLYIDLEHTRCPMCNSELRSVSKENVRGQVPHRVYRLHEDFWLCSKCGKVYWIGKHWVKIEEILRDARKYLGEYSIGKQSYRGVVSGETSSSQ